MWKDDLALRCDSSASFTGSQGLRAVFAKYDVDGSGTMDAKELTALLKDLEYSVQDESTVR